MDEKADGLGIEYKDNLKRYEGDYRNRVPHGRGILYIKKEKSNFEESFMKGSQAMAFILIVVIDCMRAGLERVLLYQVLNRSCVKPK